MALSVTHPFVSAKPDGSDPTLLQPSDWNDGHSLSGELPVTNGGTGATTAANARIALGLSTALQAEMEAGTEATLRAMSPLLIAQAIAALSTDLIYASGAWTPVITATTPGTLAVTYTTQAGHYVRVGRMVTVSFRMVVNAFTLGTATGDLFIDGLPFIATADESSFGGLFLSGIDLPVASPLASCVMTIPSTDYLIIRQSQDNFSSSTGQISGVSAGDTVAGSISYFTDAA